MITVPDRKYGLKDEIVTSIVSNRFALPYRTLQQETMEIILFCSELDNICEYKSLSLCIITGNTHSTTDSSTVRNGDINNHIAEHHKHTKHQIDCDCDMMTHSTDHYQRLTKKAGF